MDARVARGERTPQQEQEARKEGLTERDRVAWWEKGRGKEYGWSSPGVKTGWEPKNENSVRGGLSVYPGARTSDKTGKEGFLRQQEYNMKRMEQQGVVWPKDEEGN